MDFNGLRFEYALNGSPNYVAWKGRMDALLEDNGLKELIDNDILKPTTFDAKDLEKWKKCVSKVRRIILEGVQENIVSNLHRKETPFAMWKKLTNLFENNSDHKKVALKDKLQSINMQNNDIIP